MKTAPLTLILGAWTAALCLAGCTGTTSTLRYGTDGEPEHFIECIDQPMSSCYRRAMRACPAGYVLVKEESIPAGAKSGSAFGSWTHVGGSSSKMTTSFINRVVVRCKDDAPPPPQTTQP
ncbi:MAG: hypothetical protein WC943_06320 [Elusimicrobiota bacterium]|jgi:hypothetical protein